MSNHPQETFKDSRYKVPNLERALVIMEHLLDFPKGRSITELTDDLELSKNSVFRITMTLLNHGFLVRDAQKRFSLSKKLLLMGCRSFGETRFIEFAMDIMRECRDEIKESIFIGSMIEHEGVVIEQVLGLHPFKFTIDPGLRLPINCAAPCKAILAYLPENEQKLILDEAPFERFNENTITSRRAYKKELETVRELGYALDRAEQIHGAHCIGAPVFDQYGYPIAAIWATGPSDRLPAVRFDEFGQIMRRYADMISVRMGHNAMDAAPIVEEG
ncbi:MAG: IclR family transcriptional regulator [Kiritimatiellales bacterium]|nr:IclR family transcriptional regulator [Kiritimatiellales bacterium]